MTRVKICGLRDAETIRAMDGLPINEIGFMFAESRRKVTPDEAGELIAEVRRLRGRNGAAPRTAGVFVNPELGTLRETLAAAPLDVVQLHGGETPELCRAVKSEFGVEVWKVFAMLPNETASAADRLAPFRGVVEAVLIDTAGGGTGKAFDWRAIEAYHAAARELGVPLYVAGGLHPGNVGELLRTYAPDGVDVSSGVETDGKKDIVKIREFAERVNGS